MFVRVDEAMASVYLDNKLVRQTEFKPVSQQCWDLRFTLNLDRVHNSSLDMYFSNKQLLLSGVCVPSVNHRLGRMLMNQLNTLRCSGVR